jgi:hypothetical protein
VSHFREHQRTGVTPRHPLLRERCDRSTQRIGRPLRDGETDTRIDGFNTAHPSKIEGEVSPPSTTGVPLKEIEKPCKHWDLKGRPLRHGARIRGRGPTGVLRAPASGASFLKPSRLRHRCRSRRISAGSRWIGRNAARSFPRRRERPSFGSTRAPSLIC